MLFILQAFNFIFLANRIQDLLHSNHFVACPPVTAKWHELDKTDMNGFTFRPLHEIIDLAIIQTFHHNHIDFDMKIPF